MQNLKTVALKHCRFCCNFKNRETVDVTEVLLHLEYGF